jgi:hypothetical protein
MRVRAQRDPSLRYAQPHMAKKKQPDRATAHLLMRYADDFAGTSDTVGEHQAIAREHGSVWVGKLGTMTLADHRVERLREQVENKTPTYLYLVKSKDRRYQVHRGRLLEVRKTRPSSASALIPAYYPKNRRFPLWVRINGLRRVSPVQFAGVVIESSANPAAQSLAFSTASLFTVVLDPTLVVRAKKSPPPELIPKRVTKKRRPKACEEEWDDLDELGGHEDGWG